MSTSPSLLTRIVPLLWVLWAAGCGAIDSPCASEAACGPPNALCVDIGDGVDRCESFCDRDEQCGRRAHCLLAPGDAEGVCWRTCDQASDCASGSWVCAQVTESEQGYCVLALGTTGIDTGTTRTGTERLADLDDAATRALCEETAARRARVVDCGETSLDLGWPTAEACVNTWDWPEACEATVADLRRCYDFMERGTVNELCELTFHPCAALNTEACTGPGDALLR